MYGSAAGFSSYHTARGRTIDESWDDTAIESALLVASEWIDGRYHKKFIGYKTGGFTQTREWPRTTAYTNEDPIYVFANDEIPDILADATYEAAWREINDRGSLFVDFSAAKYNSVTVQGAISVEYNNSLTVQDVQKQIQIIDQILYPVFDIHKMQGALSGGSVRT